MEATIKTLATKDDLAKVKADLSKEVGHFVKWMLFFSVTQTIAFWLMLDLLIKK